MSLRKRSLFERRIAVDRKESISIDDIGWQILEELQKNSKISFKHLSEKVNLSVSAVIERVKRLEDNGVIVSYGAKIDPRKVGFSFSAILFFSTNYGNPDLVMDEIFSKIPEVSSWWSITGVYDYMLEIHVPSLEFLHDLLILLSKHGKITTHIVLPNSAKKTSISAPRETI